MGYVYNKKLGLFQYKSKLEFEQLEDYKMATVTGKTLLMLTVDSSSNNRVGLSDNATNLKIKYIGESTGTGTNDLKKNTVYTLEEVVKNIGACLNSKSGEVSWSDIKNIPNTFPPADHTHTINQITNIDQAIVAFAQQAATIPARNLRIGNSSKSFNGSDDVSWTLTEIGAAAVNHTHTIANITDISSARVAYATTAGGVSWGNVSNKPNLTSNLKNGTGAGSVVQAYNGTNFNTATGIGSMALGLGTIAQGMNSVVCGAYNVASGNTSSRSVTDLAFIIGGGTSTSNRVNAFSVTYQGSTNINGAYGTSGADYAEYFEWLDGNPNDEDRVAKFVILDGDKIRIAHEYDRREVLGVISSTPSVIGNQSSEWKDKYITDKYGRRLTRYRTDSSGNRVEEFILNPKYDPTKKYKERSKRKEWSIVALLGRVIVEDNGMCVSNGYCECGRNGIAVPSSLDEKRSFRVLKRIDKNLIEILLR